MKNFILKLLNAYSETDLMIEALKRAHDQEIHFLRNLVYNKDTEIKRLSDLVFKNFGLIHVTPSLLREMPKPLNRIKKPWNEQRSELEKADARAAADAREAKIRAEQKVAN
jgi:hypothetical protein